MLNRDDCNHQALDPHHFSWGFTPFMHGSDLKLQYPPPPNPEQDILIVTFNAYYEFYSQPSHFVSF